MTRKRWAALALLLIVALPACGQKAGVHVRGSSGFAGALSPEEAVAEGGEAIASGGEGAGGAAGSSGGGGTRTTTTRNTTGGGGGSTGPTGPGDRTGVSDTKITIGFHAPVTGAASVPLTDIQNGIYLLSKYLDGQGKKIHGRNTETLFRDDQYSPSHAVSVCREMVEKEKVFYLVGGGGTDQIVACARYASTKGVPYLSAGVTENTVKNLKNYFAFSASYPGQAKALVQLIKNFSPPSGFGGGKVLIDRCKDDAASAANPCNDDSPGPSQPKVGLLYSDTEGFYDARDAFIREFQASFGRPPDKVKAITKFAINGTDAAGVMKEFKDQGIDVIFVLTAPANWLELLNRSGSTTQGQNYFPRWVGVGITKGIDIVATLACARYPRAFQNSLFFSPWYSVRHPDAGKDFKRAWDAYGSADDSYLAHDLAWGVWGGSIVQAAMLQAAGRNLSRQSFVAAAEKLKGGTFPDAEVGTEITDVYPPVSFSPTDHFGSEQVHLLWGHCQGESGWWDYYPGVGHFASGF